MSTEENKRLIRRSQDEGWNKENLAVLDECYMPDIALWGAVSLADMKAWVLAYRKVAPDFRTTILDMIAEDNKVVTRVKWTGTNTGPTYNPALGGWLPPTGKPFSYTGIMIHEVVNGKIATEIVESNYTDVLLEMGVNPTATP